MATFLPFAALRPNPEKAALVSAVPYDVVNSQEAAWLAEGNPLSFLHVSRPEIDMAPGIDLHSDEVYEQAGKAFAKLIAEAPLIVEEEKCFYVYTLVMNGRSQTGVFGVASAEEYRNGIIKKHEKTRQDKEDDRTRHVMTLRSHTGPAFFTYRPDAAVAAAIAEAMKIAPLFDFTSPDGISHTLRRMDAEDSQKLAKLFEAVPCFYIADGHHRSAAAARTAAECADPDPKAECNFFLACAFPADELAILPYNRFVHDLNGKSAAEFLTEMERTFNITATRIKTPAKGGEFAMYLEGEWYCLACRFDPATLGVIERLDVSILQDNVLGPLLGIDDPRTSTRIEFVGGIRGTAELEKLVDAKPGSVAFSMYPTTVEQLMDIADSGNIMPPKSTWFEPKLRDGLVSHNF